MSLAINFLIGHDLLRFMVFIKNYFNLTINNIDCSMSRLNRKISNSSPIPKIGDIQKNFPEFPK